MRRRALPERSVLPSLRAAEWGLIALKSLRITRPAPIDLSRNPSVTSTCETLIPRRVYGRGRGLSSLGALVDDHLQQLGDRRGRADHLGALRAGLIHGALGGSGRRLVLPQRHGDHLARLPINE